MAQLNTWIYQIRLHEDQAAIQLQLYKPQLDSASATQLLCDYS